MAREMAFCHIASSVYRRFNFNRPRTFLLNPRTSLEAEEVAAGIGALVLDLRLQGQQGDLADSRDLQFPAPPSPQGHLLLIRRPVDGGRVDPGGDLIHLLPDAEGAVGPGGRKGSGEVNITALMA